MDKGPISSVKIPDPKKHIIKPGIYKSTERDGNEYYAPIIYMASRHIHPTEQFLVKIARLSEDAAIGHVKNDINYFMAFILPRRRDGQNIVTMFYDYFTGLKYKKSSTWSFKNFIEVTYAEQW